MTQYEIFSISVAIVAIVISAVSQSWSPFFGQSDKVKIRLTEGGGNEQTEPEAVLCGV
jgi:hypothetical protein